jgi:hypothetical protein
MMLGQDPIFQARFCEYCERSNFPDTQGRARAGLGPDPSPFKAGREASQMRTGSGLEPDWSLIGARVKLK